jgi:hypothetical protein
MNVPTTRYPGAQPFSGFDKVKRDRTGVASDSQGLSPDALKNIQTSVLAASVDMSRMKVEAIARIFAETGIKSLMMHIHELLLKHQNKAKIIKLRGEWVPVNPAEWRERTDMTVNIGLGIGTREQNLLHLNAIAEKQAQIVQAGSPRAGWIAPRARRSHWRPSQETLRAYSARNTMAVRMLSSIYFFPLDQRSR